MPDSDYYSQAILQALERIELILLRLEDRIDLQLAEEGDEDGRPAGERDPTQSLD